MPHRSAEYQVRHAMEVDAWDIARVHVNSHRTTYKGIFPDGYLDRFSVEERAGQWSARIAANDTSSVTLVGCDGGGQVVGFAAGGAERSGSLSCDGELYAIYLLPQDQRRGLGTVLFRRFGSELRARGFGSMAVWVLARNTACRFYERLGGQVIGGEERGVRRRALPGTGLRVAGSGRGRP
jgi:GNAT superfamily N-acetyltransferase